MSAGARHVPAGYGALGRPWRPFWPLPLWGSDRAWAIALVVPYAAVFVAFVLYPVAYGLWMARDPSLYGELIADPLYARSLVNTCLFVGVGVNLQMALALLLSGFFTRRRWWIRALLPVFMLPWALPAIPAFVSFHWMLIGEEGLVDGLIRAVLGVGGPLWLRDRWLALGSNVGAYVWKWLPFWTLTFYAARTAIPREIHEAAEVDGAGSVRRFAHIVLPLLGNLYLVCTLLFTLWTVGEFTAVELVSEGAPAHSSNVLATLGIQYAFEAARPALGVAAVASALPILVPLAIVLVRAARARTVEL